MKAAQFGGGAHKHGVPASMFDMPAGLHVRYEAPDRALAECITGYAIYAAEDRAAMVNWYLPSPPMLSIVLDAGPITVSLGNHRFGPLDPVSLYGPTSRAFRTVTHGGIAVGIGISALGWARMTQRHAGDFHNRVVPASALLGADFVERLREGLDVLDDETSIKPLLDDMLAPLFATPNPRERLIRAFTALTITDGVVEMKDVAERLEVPTHELRRVATRYFGMPPKMLLRRARFLRSFIGLIRDGALGDYSQIDSSYFDASHFLRDAGTFLGTTPRRFLAAETIFLQASLRARLMVLGAPTATLHDGVPRIRVSHPHRDDDLRVQPEL
ncbi:hypothetical protein U1737_14890 [Sphingomonas sp. LB3N6]|uniref:hypothetical protein n=1 Tax=Sphingomonas fucosidasi TaxID=3096164 RepID=UPI002FCA80B8